MAYNRPPTKSTGNTWSAGEHNIYVRDNAMVSVPDVFENKGDLIVGAGTDAGIIVPAGADGKVLVADSTKEAGVDWKDTKGFIRMGDLAITMASYAQRYTSSGTYLIALSQFNIPAGAFDEVITSAKAIVASFLVTTPGASLFVMRYTKINNVIYQRIIHRVDYNVASTITVPLYQDSYVAIAPNNLPMDIEINLLGYFS